MEGDLLPETGTLVHNNGHGTRSIDGHFGGGISCNLCRHVFGNLRKSTSSSGRTEYSLKTKTMLVKTVAKNGCHLCVLLLGAFCEPPDFGEPSSLASLPDISASIWLDGLDKLAGDLWVKYYDESGQTYEPGGKDVFPSYGDSHLELELEPESMNPISLEAGDSTDSESSWACITYWLDECTSGGTHKLCQQPRTSGRPKRLLNVSLSNDGTGISMRLCENTEVPIDGIYVTLSHCWGTLQHIRLTEAMLPSFKIQIPWEMLSRTFQDAAFITCKLGVEWLWIDSLCIIQDSLEDWRMESKNMQSIYANSFCNISAADAKDGSEGCFRDRSPFAIQPCTITIDGQTRYAMDTGSWHRNVNRYHINSRTWVMQERLLSPRILYYTKDQIIWECNEGIASEKEPYILPPRYTDARQFNRLTLESPSNGADQHSKPSKDEIRKAWNMVITQYSRCELTHESDKLIALDGLTSRVRELLEEEDVFGLWPTNIEFQLTWNVASGQWGKHAARRLPPEIAPSWSWASIHGWGISPENGHLRIDYSFRAVSHSKASWHAGQPSAGTVFPDQRPRILGLQCMLFPVMVETIHRVITVTQATPTTGRDSSTLFCHLDTDDDRNFVEAAGKIWCAPLFSLVSKERDPILEGLLLEQNTSEKSATFRRVGTFSNAIDLPPKGLPLRLPRPVDLPFEESRSKFNYSDIPFKDRNSSEPDSPETPSDGGSSIEFDTSRYDGLVREFLQDRFPGAAYPGADIIITGGIEMHNIILC